MSNEGRKRARRKALLTNRMKRKLALLFTIIVLALIGVNVRLAYINKTNGDKYTKRVLAQQDTNSTLLPYRRGDILDRNGTILATSEKVYNLILDPKVLSQNADEEDPDKDCVEPTLQALVQYFGLDEAELRATYNDRIDSSYVVLLRQLTKDEISEFEALMEDDEAGARIKGVWFEDSYIRRYPYDSLACHVIGYTVTGNQGQTGIEQEYSDVLNGTNGRSYKYLNEDLEQSTMVRQPTDGNTVVSTIDATLQEIVEKYIDKFIEDYTNKNTEGPAAKNIGVIMMNPQNGEILAMASDVDYDLNNPHDLVENGYLTQEEADAMSEEELLDARNQMWRNFCISDGYEPGSTVKPLTVAAALELGVVSDSSTFVCDGGQTVVEGQPRIKCAKRAGHGLITLEGALMFSCNDALMQIGAMLGYENYLKYQEIFNFGLKTNIDLPGEANNATTVFNEDTLGVTELATSSFGQGYNTTMIQVASAFSSVINGGYYYQPHVVKKILDADGGTVENIGATLVRQTVSEKTSSLIRQYLYHTMYGEADSNGNNATGRNARVAGYAMGGKTGTAQKIPRSDRKYLVSFIGFAPVDNPQVVCYVVVDEPNAADATAQASSSFAQEIFKNIMTEAMPYLNIYATEEIPADMQDEVDAQKAAEEESGSTEEGTEEETAEEELPEGTLIDPNTGETVTMPTEEELESEDAGDMMGGIDSPILPADGSEADTGEEDASQ
ncbi:MAG TPA: penicillin-binding protein 2 [Candidatus Merdisoma faecalis]|uniref:peptidoglycan D,D-transpeptidase FtsI family protein n=1 Tax=Lachnoclostridium sp. An138 TaxID=1965560 RepID=UPI000B37AE71|nr:penicillin-binding protein 2 [Lachnoclostridium sp. An138]HIR96936.1 penicillin-binding protein 2 [Candidatus Merdisoma faecalis]